MLFSLNSGIELGGFKTVKVSCRPVLMRLFLPGDQQLRVRQWEPEAPEALSLSWLAIFYCSFCLPVTCACLDAI